MKFTNGRLADAVNNSFTDVEPGLAGADTSAPVMTTPATIVTTPEDVALTTAALNATAAVVNATHAGKG